MSWLSGLRADLASLHEKADRILSAQQDINEAVSVLNTFFTDLSNVIAELQAGGGGANTAQLNQVISQVPALQSAVNSLVPAPGTSTTTTGTHTSSSATG